MHSIIHFVSRVFILAIIASIASCGGGSVSSGKTNLKTSVTVHGYHQSLMLTVLLFKRGIYCQIESISATMEQMYRKA
jgi:hypothetical protein